MIRTFVVGAPAVHHHYQRPDSCSPLN